MLGNRPEPPQVARVVAIALLVSWFASWCASCSNSKPGTVGTAHDAAQRADGGGVSAGTTGGFGNHGDGSVGGSGAGTGDAGVPVLPSCVKQASTAQHVPVDMYIMLDRSGSMLQATGAGPNKWDAIRAALTSFVQDARSKGLGVGLQYFPLGQPGVPDSCTADANCGTAGGPCLNKACLPSNPQTFPFTLCVDDNDCPFLSAGCAPFGTCSNDATLACFNFGPTGCGAQGACAAATNYECLDYTSCDVAVYAAPAVPIAPLPGNAKALVASLMAEKALGLTPTSAALSGALRQAEKQAAAQPMHRVIAVLATDGEPTQCDPIDAAGVAGIAAGGVALTPEVRTYVIGVFGPDDTGARTNLDLWAQHGGSDQAFIVDPTQDVTTQFLDALESIRSGSASCEYQLPPAPVGSQLDLGFVNVALIEPGSSRDAVYVGDASKCTSKVLGWYYDAPPDSGKARKIIVCKSVCDELHVATSTRVDIRLGCKTKGPE